MNENDAYIFDVETPAEWVFDGGHVWIGGWFLSKTGAVFSDIRAVIEGVPHLGILGLPRPEIEQRHRGYAGLPHAGFSLRVKPPRSAREIRIELLDAGHRWVEIWRSPIRVRRGENTIGRYQHALLPDQLHRLLQARRADPAADLAPLADELALAAAAVPLDTLPIPPFFGALEKPELVGGTQYGKVRVEGWIIHREKKITRLIASTHPNVENELDYGDRERGDAGDMFPGHPYAARSSYFGMLDIDENQPGPVLIRMFAELEDGGRHLVFARRFHPRACTAWERPLPVYSDAALLRCAGILAAACRARRIRLGRLRRISQALGEARRLLRRECPEVLPAATSTEPYAEWQASARLSPRLREALQVAAGRLPSPAPRLLVLVDATAGPGPLVDSLAAQIYPHWEAVVVHRGEAPGDRGAVRHVTAGDGEGLLRALNAALQRSGADLVTLLPASSRLSADALAEVAERFAVDAKLELAYTDEDRMDAAGRRSEPAFKPEWSPTLALSGLFPGHLSVVRRPRLVAAGGFRPGTDTVPWYDALLRITDRIDSTQVAHLPLVCHHAAAELPRTTDLADRSYEQARAALAEALRRRGLAAVPFLPEAGHQRRLRFHQPRWDASALARNPVTIVIPTRDRLHLLQECVERLDETVDWRHARLVIVDDHSRDADVKRYLERIQQRRDLRCIVVRTPDPGAPFNYSRLVNAALPVVDTPLILHLNNDVNALERGWLEEMAGWFSAPDVGVVGAKLIYPDRTLNHTGIIVGPHGGLADTPFARVPEAEVPVEWHAAAREVSAVTGACLLTRTDLYRELGGFAEGDLGVAYNDVDYCLRARAAGRRVIYTPQAKLMHWGSATRGVTFDEAEHVAFLRRHGGSSDPCCSPHLEFAGGRLACRRDAAVRRGRAGSLRLLLFTHNLNLEGAPLYLLELATHLVRHEGFRVEVAAAQDGPLRDAYAALGVPVRLVDAGLVYSSPDEETFFRRLDDLGAPIHWDEVDLVFANTLQCFWGVLLARRAGKPSVFTIHESTSVFRFFELKLELPLHHLVHEALAGASATLFLCQATRAYYEDDNLRGNFRLVTSWIDLPAIARFQAAHDRAALRRKHGILADAVVIANIGTVCERKGQHIFIRAAERFNREHPGENVVFLLVGARPGIYLDLLRRDIARLGLRNLTLVPETREAYDFFQLADMFVCTSYEESFPRVVMEAMAFGTPIVSTDVHGIPELIGQRQDGYLVPPGDADGLARMMHACLAKERSGKSLAPAARSRVQRFHDAARVLPRHADLLRSVWLAHE